MVTDARPVGSTKAVVTFRVAAGCLDPSVARWAEVGVVPVAVEKVGDAAVARLHRPKVSARSTGRSPYCRLATSSGHRYGTIGTPAAAGSSWAGPACRRATSGTAVLLSPPRHHVVGQTGGMPAEGRSAEVVHPPPTVSVLVDKPIYLHVLDEQSLGSAEIISWNDEDWHTSAKEMAGRHGWRHTRVDSEGEAVAQASGEFIVGWGAAEAAPSALELLSEAASAEASKKGAVTANFDPLILWRREEFAGKSDRKGLVEVDVYAFAGGRGTNVHPFQ